MVLAKGQLQTVTLPDGSQYDLYLPSTYDATSTHRLLVSAQPHSGDLLPRYFSVELCRDIAEARGDAVLAPRFDISSGFQWLGLWDATRQQPVPAPAVRFDLQLLAMVADAAQRFGVAPAPVDLFGYSAGGQFAHRFLYLHPACLNAVAIGAPGSITVPSLAYAWPEGFTGLAELAGMEPNLPAVRQRRILLFVGDHDVTSERVVLNAAANQFGMTRVERARILHAQWQAAGIAGTYAEIPGMAHFPFDAAMGMVRQFFLDGEARSAIA